MKIAYFGYDFFDNCLEYLIGTEHEIKWLFTFDCDNEYNFNTRVIELANENNIEIVKRKVTEEDIKVLKIADVTLLYQLHIHIGYQLDM
ncbi:MAG: hypothetical protein N4A47_01785 [Clostridia bacterium]|jgi:hypothetical protein|nr:hypothetical protein [Clostridia bacterium]